ncbi:MAG: hypothetical protein IKR05_08420 [Prevotella sp.]|nr:hypothetical protein [Prevotella sp.]
MRIIKGNTALRQLIPNTLATVPGEPSWYEKLYPSLQEAERWLEQNITGKAVLDALQSEDDTNIVKQVCAKIITAQALMSAIPSLDLVLTPNGFGIVNTQNVVPASKDRIERLINSVEKQRDEAIDTLLCKLPSWEGWLESPQGRFFAATLFPRLSICRRLAVREHLWDKYQEIRTRLIKIEAVLAQTYFSPEQMDVFRQKVIKQLQPNAIMTDVIRQLQSLEMMLVTDMQVHPQSFFDIVNTIREHADIFPEWHQSKTAELYMPITFLNKKESSGYFF